ADVFRIRIAAHNLHVGTDALGGTVTALLGIGGSAVNLLQLSVIHVHAKRAFDRVQVGSVAVCRDLYAPTNALSAVLHKVHCPSAIAAADEVADAELRVRVDSGPRPSISPSFRFSLGADVLRLCPDEAPNLITLQTAHPHVADVSIVVLGTCGSHIQ